VWTVDVYVLVEMGDGVPGLKRDTTMSATAKEGAEFLKSQGHDEPTVVDADVKTRGQKRELEEITTEPPPKVARAKTMAVTAEVGRHLVTF
jgi:hypothetical protein